jgi:hypothetical protein
VPPWKASHCVGSRSASTRHCKTFHAAVDRIYATQPECRTPKLWDACSAIAVHGLAG